MNAYGARRGRLIPAIAIGAGAWFVFERAGPLMIGGEINPVAAAALFFLVLSGMTALIDGLRLLSDLATWMKVRIPIGLRGTAGWVRSLREINHDLVRKGWGPYWGVFKGSEVISDFLSNAMTLGHAGVGKGVRVLQATVLAIRHSKTIIDFKGELACVLAGALRKRGETVRVLNIGDMWTDILGPSDEYNPLHVIADDFQRPGGIQDVSDDIEEMCLQLLPEPEGEDAKGDKYWRDGGRTFVGFAIQTCVLINGPNATLGDVAQMLNDRRSLYQHALWACGRLAQKEAIS